jgi:hypothetical protein
MQLGASNFKGGNTNYGDDWKKRKFVFSDLVISEQTKVLHLSIVGIKTLSTVTLNASML